MNVSKVLEVVKYHELEYDRDEMKDAVDEIMKVFDFYEVEIEDYHRKRISRDLLETVEDLFNNRDELNKEDLVETIEDMEDDEDE